MSATDSEEIRRLENRVELLVEGVRLLDERVSELEREARQGREPKAAARVRMRLA